MKSFIKQIQRKFNQQSIPKTGFLQFLPVAHLEPVT